MTRIGILGGGMRWLAVDGGRLAGLRLRPLAETVLASPYPPTANRQPPTGETA
jgi:hypothetical protein